MMDTDNWMTDPCFKRNFMPPFQPKSAYDFGIWFFSGTRCTGSDRSGRIEERILLHPHQCFSSLCASSNLSPYQDLIFIKGKKDTDQFRNSVYSAESNPLPSPIGPWTKFARTSYTWCSERWGCSPWQRSRE